MSAAPIIAPRRPVLRWHGGKWKLAPKILPYLPPHHTYTETYGGAASILLRKPRSYAEVYNDLDDEVVTLFRVLRDERLAPRLIEALRLTPFARVEFQDAYQPSDDPVEIARRLVVRSFMGVGTDAAASDITGGFRCNTSRKWQLPAHDWGRIPDNLLLIMDRLQGVVIENRPAMQIMAQHDREGALHFVDPPYLWATRGQHSSSNKLYRHEMTDAQHAELLAFLRTLRGGVVLCGYASALYDDALGDWTRVELPALADGARPRTEVLWINAQAWDGLIGAKAQSCMLATMRGDAA